MKAMATAVCICALLTLTVLAQVSVPNDSDISGTWKARIVSAGPVPKMWDEAVFEFKADHGKLSGQAHIGGWPGSAPLSDGKVNADWISFTYVGVGRPSVTLKFSGTIRGHEMKITLVDVDRVYQMDGTKVLQ